MLIVGVKGDNGSSPPSTGLQASASAPVSTQKANLLGDANGGSAAAPHTAARARVPEINSLIHPLLGFSVQLLLGQQQSYSGWKLLVSVRRLKGAPALFALTRWPEEITPGG